MKNYIMKKVNTFFAYLTIVYLPQPYATYALTIQTKLNELVNYTR